MPKFNPAGYGRKMGNGSKKKPKKVKNFQSQMAKANKILSKRK